LSTYRSCWLVKAYEFPKQFEYEGLLSGKTGRETRPLLMEVRTAKYLGLSGTERRIPEHLAVSQHSMAWAHSSEHEQTADTTVHENSWELFPGSSYVYYALAQG
jgi:hypothetical protein